MSPRSATRRVLPGSPFNVAAPVVSSADRLTVHDQVTHDRYGLGRVVRVESEVAVLVDFGSGVRRVTIPSPKLTKL